MAEKRTHPDYTLQLVEHGDMLEVRVSGDIDAQRVRIAYWREIADEAKARGLRKLLVTDRRKGEPAKPAELAELAALFQHEAKHFDRVAVIEPTPEFLPAIEYAEIFGQGMGINVRIFSEHREAERWLRYGSPDD
ncbi:SpoIIAA family protein [Lysobacter solisilvae (ex Woo and Kim 2020)]|uniref:STAS/SEC14 domain-containing protein n=1 Tax=Agrilutibacter terrestris TaxID=2865112 RepID=A0A7H0FX12_9GAMM|nr:STAS/SEC14 domain-containing protein [Lysobacter terrestris]QNP40578.1 STAS/SEC14 domain-containing protein [Lysobacter terrestris]